MATDLYFDLDGALRLAEHAVAAPEHSRFTTEMLDGEPCPGALVWVADRGTCLMSTGLPAMPADPHDPNSPRLAVYAEGWGPDSDREALADTDVGGDDFIEHLHLTTTDTPNTPTLIDLLRTAASYGCRYLVIRVDDGSFHVRTAYTKPSRR